MTKCTPKKLKLKNDKKWDLAKFENRFFILTFFWGHLVTKVSLLFWNQHKILDFLKPYMTYFKKKNFHLSEGSLVKFCDTKTQKRYKRHKIKKSAFSKIVLDIFCRSITTWSIVNLKNHWTLVFTCRVAISCIQGIWFIILIGVYFSQVKNKPWHPWVYSLIWHHREHLPQHNGPPPAFKTLPVNSLKKFYFSR